MSSHELVAHSDVWGIASAGAGARRRGATTPAGAAPSASATEVAAANDRTASEEDAGEEDRGTASGASSEGGAPARTTTVAPREETREARRRDDAEAAGGATAGAEARARHDIGRGEGPRRRAARSARDVDVARTADKRGRPRRERRFIRRCHLARRANDDADGSALTDRDGVGQTNALER